jgi:penicillin-binding protein 1C
MYSKLAKQLQSNASQRSWKEITTEQASRTADDEHPDSVLNDAVIYEMFEAMSEVNRPEAQSGWMDFLSRQKIAWKTGTSFGQRDAWAVGVTPGYVVGVWVGNASGEGKPLLTGIEAAGPLLFDIFSLLPKSAWFTAPDKELVEINRCKFSGDRAGDLCDDVVLTQVPKTCLPAGICRFHKVVYIDVSSGLRAHGACSDQEQLQARNWFVLPPLMEHYYKLEHPEYLSLPAWKPGCLPENDVPVMAFIAPAPQAEITIPRSFDGSPTSYVAEITHIHPETRVFWFLDGKMLSSTRTFHQQAIQAEPGEHELFVVDELGNELSRKFRLLD